MTPHVKGLWDESIAADEDLDLGSIAVLRPQRWFWAASRVQKKPGGLQRAFFGRRVPWNERLLALPAHTGCLHWFRWEDGASLVSMLSQERGFVRLADVTGIETGTDESSVPSQCVLTLLDSGLRELLTVRGDAALISAWEKAIRAARHQTSDLAHCLWLQNLRDGVTAAMTPPLPIAVDDPVSFQDPLIQLMGFAVEKEESLKSGVSGTCHGFGQGGPKLRLLVVSQGQLWRFEFKELSLLGERRGEPLELSSLRSASLLTSTNGNSSLLLTFPNVRLIMKTPHSKEWEICLTNSKLWRPAPCTPRPAVPTARSSPASQHQILARCRHYAKEAGFILLLCNCSLAVAFWLRGTWCFWAFVVLANAVILCSSAWGTFPGGRGREAASVVGAGDGEKETAFSDYSPSCSALFLELGSAPGCAENGDATAVLVRGPSYASKKLKQASGPAMYELVRVQVLSPPAAGGKHCHVAAHAAVLEELCVARGKPKEGSLPQLLVVNVQLKEGRPSLLPGPAGECTSVVFYFRLPAETEAAAANLSQADPGVRLLEACCRKAPSKRGLKERLKVICQVCSTDGNSAPGILSQVNGKPALISKAGTLFEGPGYLEVDIDISSCSYLLRSSLHKMRGILASLELLFSVVLEGESEEELPERVWACAKLHRVNLLDLQQAASSPRPGMSAASGASSPYSPKTSPMSCLSSGNLSPSLPLLQRSVFASQPD
ncbi:unnamed protein product [Polarella glacialis]|uniref:Protein ENHANCED DISEASE RESISTANCE 2 C-terminal domain-containing protein n=1 Tax=Polarella glacialis TaxID=89957 RepID=A0A813L0P2_POLGL|nr:unnamed protein product [Polarella glacialis]